MKRSWNEINVSPGKNEHLWKLSVIHKLILPHLEESKKPRGERPRSSSRT